MCVRRDQVSGLETIGLDSPQNVISIVAVSIDNVLIEHGEHVLPLAVHLDFFAKQVEGVILSHCYPLSFFIRGLLHA